MRADEEEEGGKRAWEWEAAVSEFLSMRRHRASRKEEERSGGDAVREHCRCALHPIYANVKIITTNRVVTSNSDELFEIWLNESDERAVDNADDGEHGE